MKAIFINLKNKEQVNWFRNTANKLVNVVAEQDIIETATGERVGLILVITGLFAGLIERENVKRFIKNPKPLTVKVD